MSKPKLTRQGVRDLNEKQVNGKGKYIYIPAQMQFCGCGDDPRCRRCYPFENRRRRRS